MVSFFLLSTYFTSDRALGWPPCLLIFWNSEAKLFFSTNSGYFGFFVSSICYYFKLVRFHTPESSGLESAFFIKFRGFRSWKDFAYAKPLGVFGCETTGFCSGGLGWTRGFLLFLENYIGCDLTISMRFIGSSSTSEVAAFFGPPFYLFFFFLFFFLLSCSVCSDSSSFSLGSSVPKVLSTSLGISIILCCCFTTASGYLASSWLAGSSLSLGT